MRDPHWSREREDVNKRQAGDPATNEPGTRAQWAQDPGPIGPRTRAQLGTNLNQLKKLI